MAKDGLFAFICASLLLVAQPSPGASTKEDSESAVANALAMQTAMQQGRDFLNRSNPQAAVEVLEKQLAKIDGNPSYLRLLREAYRASVTELRLANQEDKAKIYVRRLRILEPGVPMERLFQGAKALAAQASESSARTAKAEIPSTTQQIKPKVVRGSIPEDDDPFRQGRKSVAKKAVELLARAEQEFEQRHFREAGDLFEKAHQDDPSLTDKATERWAYCKMHHVVEQLNQSPSATDLATLESEIRRAMEMAPRLDYGKTLLKEIAKRRSDRAAPAACPEITIRHSGRCAEGWAVAETADFRIFHNQTQELAEQAARVAEKTRWEMQRKWFGTHGDDWNPKCELYLHANAQDYSRATETPEHSPGHSSFDMTKEGRVIRRRIHLHCDNLNMLTAVLPHETTHVVLAGNFGSHSVPRWADEGIAVLSEPEDKIERHLRNLPKHRQDSELFHLVRLVQMDNYPEPRYMGSFYAQSVSLTKFLSKEKGPQVFTQFVRDGLNEGYETALQRHYGFRSFADLEQHWEQFAFGQAIAPVGVAQGNR